MHAQQRIRVEIIEADVQSVFGLIDAAHAAALLGDTRSAQQVLASAEQVYDDIEQRLVKLQDLERAPFLALVAEVRRELDGAYPTA